VPVRVLDGDPDAGHGGPQRGRRRGEDGRRDQVQRLDRVGAHVVGQRPVGADRRPAVPENRRDAPHYPRRPPGDEHEPRPGRLDPGERGHGARRDRPVPVDDRPVQVGRHEQRKLTHNQ